MVRNKKAQSDSESKGEIDDEESDFEKYSASDKDGYRPITTCPEDELNLNTDGEINTGESKTENKINENQKIGRFN